MTVTLKDECEINGKKYRIKGRVAGAWLDPFVVQSQIGDADYSNRRDLSSYIITAPLYIGIENMDERIDANKVWWTDCITKYRNHILPPRLATSLTAPTANPTAPTIVNADMELTTGWTNGARSVTQAHAGTYSWLMVFGDTSPAYQALSGYVPGCAYTFSCWVWADTATHARIAIDDGVATTYSSYHSGGSSWEQLSVARTLPANATKLELEFHHPGSGSGIFFDDATITSDTTMTITPISRSANFNGNLYVIYGQALAKLNAGRTAFTAVAYFGSAPTALTSSLNSRLYIYMGDSTNYYYMNTSEVLTQSNSANANWGIQFDAKLFKLKTDGTVAYSTDPDGATPTWTSGGAITDIADQIEGFVIGRDASGNITLYVATNSILKAYDDATPQWVDTEVKLPNHPIGGKGVTFFNGKLYLSYGLGVKEYYTETGSLIDIGLTERDGLPAEYNGEIVKLLGDSGSKGMFAAIDASVPSGNSKSGLYVYDGEGWQCWWTPPTTLIEDCEDAWTSPANVTASLDTTDFQVGAGSAKFVVADAFAGVAGTPIGFENISSLDLSQHNSVSLRVKSSITLTLGQLQLLLDNTNGCGSPLETIDIPAITADTWTKVVLTLANPSSDTAIISVGIQQTSDLGAFTLNLDQIEGQTYDGVMSDVIVSSASSGYAVYYDHDGKVYYIDIPRGVENPDKITQSYATSGILITPWFDAGNPVAAKLAKVLADFAKGITTTETVALKYRIDHTYTDLDTGWTTLDTLNTTGEDGYNEELFASGAGLSYKAIQYRLDFVTGGSTSKADIQSLVFYYKKRTGSEKIRTWSVVVVCNEEFGTGVKEKVDNLATAIISATDVLFSYHSTAENTAVSYYVSVDCPGFSEETGRDYTAEYKLTLIES